MVDHWVDSMADEMAVLRVEHWGWWTVDSSDDLSAVLMAEPTVGKTVDSSDDRMVVVSAVLRDNPKVVETVERTAVSMERPLAVAWAVLLVDGLAVMWAAIVVAWTVAASVVPKVEPKVLPKAAWTGTSTVVLSVDVLAVVWVEH